MAVVRKNYMGLEMRAEGGKYISIYKGRFAQRVPAGTEGAVARVLEKGPKAGQTVFEKYYDSFTGKLVGIKTAESPQFGKQWDFSFQDAGEVYHLTLPYSNSFAKNILKMLPNVDLNQEMKVTPQTKDDGTGVMKSSVFINQGGASIKHAFTKDAPNGLPQMKQITVSGKLVWDDTEQLVFLQNMVDTIIVPKLPKVAEAESLSSRLEEVASAGAEADDDRGF